MGTEIYGWRRRLCEMRRVSDLKVALRRAGFSAPYLGELTKDELHKWIAKYMTDEDAEYVFEVIRRDE